MGGEVQRYGCGLCLMVFVCGGGSEGRERVWVHVSVDAGRRGEAGKGGLGFALAGWVQPWQLAGQQRPAAVRCNGAIICVWCLQVVGQAT